EFTPRGRAFLGVKLNSDDILRSRCSDEAIAVVRTPCDRCSRVIRLADIAVCEIRRRERRCIEQSIVRIINGVPTNLWYALCRKFSDSTWNYTESRTGAFFAFIEEQLHSKADSETWQSTLKC